MPKRVWLLIVETLMDVSQEFAGGGAGQGVFAVHLINGALNDDMSAGLQGEGAGFFFKLSADKRPLDVATSRVVALDQVRVIPGPVEMI